ncbi:type II toxin-antitoxin system HipA family toxin [Pseudomonas sp. NUPR-001]|uniref:type II toxin-antitoxin system HipA family toxin n=1 Tax=Pseudomonas sp. NUPR-001 TaxID=3416058 RepID=UPI003F9AC3D5
MGSDALNVAVRGESIGDLARADSAPGATSFRYRQSADDSQAVSLTMPVRRDDYLWEQGLHPIFEMNLPEGYLRSRLQQMFSKVIRGFDDLDLLSIVGPHQLGRVIVGGQSDGSMPGTSINELLVYDGAHGLFEDLLTTYAKYSGVSGVQPKVLVRDEGADDFDRVTHRGATHIVKAWRAEDYPELAANEFFCMRAAELAGLAVPKFQLSSGGKFLIVERFDIDDQGYLGLEDFCVLNGWGAKRKYDGSYEGGARQIKLMVEPSLVQESLLQYFRCVALSAAVRGGDAHLKNFALLYNNTGDDAVIKLAPAYDIVTTTPYNPQDMMALMMEGSKAFPKHKRLAQFGRVMCGFTERAVGQILQEIADGISDARKEMVEYIESNPQFELIGTKMLDAWNAGVTRSLMSERRAKVIDMGEAQKPASPREGSQ